MAHYIVTYDIDNATNRTDFVADFETRLQRIGLRKEHNNQSTYFGFHGHAKIGFMIELCAALASLDWAVDDTVTVYYPKATNSTADIGKHRIKRRGDIELHSVIE